LFRTAAAATWKIELQRISNNSNISCCCRIDSCFSR
jgi:hypothetical protein